MAGKILIVEDERAIREMVALYLLKQNYEVIEAEDYQSAVNRLEEQPQLILLDWMLPGRSGIMFIEYLKKQEQTAKIPIIMLTARSAEEDCITCLNAGADDYITKPFSPKILLARIEALWRRSYDPPSQIVSFENLQIDQQAQRVSVENQFVELSATEYKLLLFLMTHPEKVYSREQLLNHIWGDDIYVEDRTVDSYIRRLRRSLEPFQADRYVQTVRGFGYRFSNHFQD
ncbi:MULTISPECIES: phosphate regulon transcriptional regulator PhoB [Gallibacterium]|uniref:Phosphate regulon transcriptional regulatory protein PhoB n=3 Tax=Gallibacterium TaxID=155493 RepID=A0A0A2ZNH5_9PAST|nr:MULTISPECIES: phosphate regulon transcriptional regulator PhoB [Gallibacterium]AEC17116.1 transcriptional regulator PhoB [Gallibacterium anatis UMN179]KGQ23731.1 transcriptional regulator PhoB [Gallibacterium anatis CCM5995]KGQ24574.1 transcriptional regulator PhoB [Gallibacterium anatis]KGQ24893.1 transcriptional regulator PhoB [Gallibacterium anatis]KGQ37753.1 transcriptional regulator PhoB [Gallibacterium genomosp. 1]